MSATESEKKVVVGAAAEKEAKTATKVVVEKKDDATFVSVSPVGSKEYTDELRAWELEHAIIAPEVIISPEPK